MKSLASGIAALTAAALMSAATHQAFAESAAYEIDAGHTSLYFQVGHVGFTNMFGRFNEMSGTIEFDPDDPASGQFDLTINAASVDTNHARRDEHLRSPDFFNVGEFPEITYSSTDIAVTGESTARITGDFTMLGVTQPVTMDVTLNKMGPYPFVEGQVRLGFSGTGMLDRTDFGMTYGSGGIGDVITLHVEVEAFR